jgi:hypothetical protein
MRSLLLLGAAFATFASPATLTVASAAETSPLYGWAAVTTYHLSCGQSVPLPIINLGVAYGRTQPEAYDEQLAVVWDQKQELGTERFCAALQPRLEPLFPEMMVKARQAGFGDTSGGTFGGQDVEKILATYKANSLRFDRDYLGQSLEII